MYWRHGTGKTDIHDAKSGAHLTLRGFEKQRSITKFCSDKGNYKPLGNRSWLRWAQVFDIFDRIGPVFSAISEGKGAERGFL